jgi:hypothetical protein
MGFIYCAVCERNKPPSNTIATFGVIGLRNYALPRCAHPP